MRECPLAQQCVISGQARSRIKGSGHHSSGGGAARSWSNGPPPIQHNEHRHAREPLHDMSRNETKKNMEEDVSMRSHGASRQNPSSSAGRKILLGRFRTISRAHQVAAAHVTCRSHEAIRPERRFHALPKKNT